MSNWISAASTRPGILHVKEGSPCQDRVGREQVGDDLFLAVVSDGAGSSAHAEEGAALAVETVLAHLKLVEWGTAAPTADWAGPHFLSAAQAAVDALKVHAADRSYALKDLRCTLLAVVAMPQWIAAAQVGDGIIVIRGADRDRYRLVFQPSKGEYANETTFITEGSLSSNLRVCVADGHVNFMFLSSDGLEGLSLSPVADGKSEPRGKFFDAFYRYVTTEQPAALALQVELEKWLESPKISGGLAYDDKGVVLAYRAGAKAVFESHEQGEPADSRVVTAAGNQAPKKPTVDILAALDSEDPLDSPTDDSDALRSGDVSGWPRQ